MDHFWAEATARLRRETGLDELLSYLKDTSHYDYVARLQSALLQLTKSEPLNPEALRLLLHSLNDASNDHRYGPEQRKFDVTTKLRWPEQLYDVECWVALFSALQVLFRCMRCILDEIDDITLLIVHLREPTREFRLKRWAKQQYSRVFNTVGPAPTDDLVRDLLLLRRHLFVSVGKLRRLFAEVCHIEEHADAYGLLALLCSDLLV